MAKITKTPKKTYDPQFKAKVAIEAQSQLSTAEAVAKQFGINKTQVNSWRSQLKDNAHTLFTKGKLEVYEDKQETIDQLQQIVGQQTVEISLLKKNYGNTTKAATGADRLLPSNAFHRNTMQTIFYTSQCSLL